MHEKTSPSGTYKLVVDSIKNGKGYWDHTVGKIYGKDGALLFTVERNYSSFPAVWVENHPNGHSYLITGSDYQGQTILELDTGKRKDYLPPEAKKGHGFCWVEARFDSSALILTVRGCVWACPFEFRCYDFYDPMNIGWPELEPDPMDGLWEDVRWPEIDSPIIKCFESETVNYEDGRDEDESLSDEDTEKAREAEVLAKPPVAIKTFRREGLKIKLIDDWVSEAEQAKRKDYKEAEQKYKAELAEYRATDPLYLRAQELMKDSAFNIESYESIGTTYDGWCPDFKGEEQRICRRIVQNRRAYTIDLEYGRVSAPIKLDIYKNGETDPPKFFEHSVAGMEEAFAYARSLVTRKSWWRQLLPFTKSRS